MPPGKTNNAAKFIVSLKQNNSEGFTTKWVFEDSKFTYKTTKFVQNTLAQLWTTKRTSISRKICSVMSGFQIRY